MSVAVEGAAVRIRLAAEVDVAGRIQRDPAELGCVAGGIDAGDLRLCRAVTGAGDAALTSRDKEDASNS